MSSFSVFVTRPIPSAGIELLRNAGAVVKGGDADAPIPSNDELCFEAGRHEAVICQLADSIDESVLRASLPRCRVFATCAVGYDNIDVAAARRHGIVVTHTPGVLTEATADLTWALLMATARRLGEAERAVRSGSWGGWGMLDFLGVDVHGRTLGIVGAGRIGTAVARRAAGFAMQVVYHSRKPAFEIEAIGARRVDLAALLKESDFVSLHVPLTPQSAGMIGASELAQMKPSAILVNTSRGAIVDERALIAALRERKIGGAGLDVYWNEPLVPAELLALDNVILLPHIGSATLSARCRMAEMAAADVIAVLQGREPRHPVP